MSLTRTQKALTWLASAVGVAVVSFFAGGALKADEEPAYLFDVDAPAFQADVGSIAARSEGGFTGFGDLGSSNDRTVLGGRVVEVSATALTLETPSGVRTTLRLGASSRLSRLDDGSRQLLQPGTNVVVRLGEQDGEAAAVLVIEQP